MDFSLCASWIERNEISVILRKWLSLRVDSIHFGKCALEDPRARPVDSEAVGPALCGISPSPGFLPQDVLRVIAAVMGQGQSALSGSLRTKAVDMDLSIPVAEDVLQLEGGIHCWVDGLPTLVGTKAFVRRLGIEVPNCLPETPQGYELFAARGRQLIGWIAISQ